MNSNGLFALQTQMKQFTLTIITKEPRGIDRIESDDILELLSQFNLVIARIVKKTEYHKHLIERMKDDEIPF